MSLSFLESQLKPETAEATAKAFANVFYSQQADDSFTLERNNIIRLLKSWGSGYGDEHVDVNDDVTEILLDQLERVEQQTGEDLYVILGDFEREISKQHNERSFSVELKEYCERKIKEKWRKQKRRQFIQERDSEILGDFAVKTVSVFAPNDHTNNIDQLFGTPEDNLMIVKENSNSYLLDRHSRKRQILFAYSLVNLNKATKHWNLLKSILDRCSKEDHLSLLEKDFICHLWHKFNSTHTELYKHLSTNFNFLYEKPILKWCTAALKSEEQEVAEVTELQRIRTLVTRCDVLHDKISCLILDLYLLSGKNPKILKLYQRLAF